MSHLVQNKDEVDLNDEEIVLHDFVPVNNIFLNGDGDLNH